MASASFNTDGEQLAVKVTKPEEIVHHQIEDWQLDVLTENHDDPSREICLGAGFAAVGAFPSAGVFVHQVYNGGLEAASGANFVSFLVFFASLAVAVAAGYLSKRRPNKAISMKERIRARAAGGTKHVSLADSLLDWKAAKRNSASGIVAGPLTQEMLTQALTPHHRTKAEDVLTKKLGGE